MLIYLPMLVLGESDILNTNHESITIDSIEIRGTKKFVKQVSDCLSLIESNDQEAYKFVNKYIGVIAQHLKSGMLAWESPPKYEMSSKTANYSLTWCASTIAHDAYHSYLYQKHKPNDGKRTPSRYWSDFKAEALSILYQIEVAEKIGASHQEVNYLRSLKGNHADLDGDGKITQKDYQMRDW